MSVYIHNHLFFYNLYLTSLRPVALSSHPCTHTHALTWEHRAELHLTSHHTNPFKVPSHSSLQGFILWNVSSVRFTSPSAISKHGGTSPHLTSITHTKMEKMCLFDRVCPATLLFVVPEHPEEDKGGDARGADGLQSLGFCLKSEYSLFILASSVMTDCPHFIRLLSGGPPIDWVPQWLRAVLPLRTNRQ